MSILVVGSIAYDDVETPFGKVKDAPGGSAVHFSCAASLLAEVAMVGVVGQDYDFSKINFLKNRNVNFEGITVEKGDTFRWGGKYHTDINKRDTLYTHLNVFQNFDPNIPENLRNSAILFLANIDPHLQLKVLDQMHKPDVVITDTMNFWISGQKDVLLSVIAKTDILILNDEEIRQLTSENSLLSAAESVLKMGPKYVIIKKGEHGALLIGKDLYFSAPAFPLKKVVDPTGAGDSFAGGFVGYIASLPVFAENDLRKAVIYGSAAASFNVEDFSFNKLKNANLSDLELRVEKFADLVRF